MAKAMPGSVKVGPHVYSVSRSPSAALGDALGDCDCTTLRIRVRARLRRSKAQEILLHEIIHAILNGPLLGTEKYDDEVYIEATAGVLLQVLRENPELVIYLTT